MEKYHEKVLALKSDGGWEHGDSKEWVSEWLEYNLKTKNKSF